MNKLHTLEFNGSEIEIITSNGEKWVPVAPLSTAIGVNPIRQLRKALKDPKKFGLRAFVFDDLHYPSIPVSKLGRFLFSINRKRIPSEDIGAQLSYFQDYFIEAVIEFTPIPKWIKEDHYPMSISGVSISFNSKTQSEDRWTVSSDLWEAYGTNLEEAFIGLLAAHRSYSKLAGKHEIDFFNGISGK